MGRKGRGRRAVPIQVYDEAAADEAADEGRTTVRQYDAVESFEYELPEDFEDEEIEEDEAFTAEDYKLFGDVGSKRKRGDDDSGRHGKRPRSAAEDERYVSDSDSESDVDEESHARLVSAVTGHAAADDAAAAASAPDGKRPGRRRKKEVGEVGTAEGGLNVRAVQARGDQVQVGDVMAALEGQGEFTGLRKQLDHLQRKSTPVSTPLADIKKDRLQRQVGYEKSVKTLKKWKPVVAAQAKAPHTHFPLKNVAEDAEQEREVADHSVHSSAVLSTFKPANELEARVAQMLQASGLTEEKLLKHQELAMNKLSVDEVRERQNELVRMRHLLLYQERKFRLRKKIKSKKYRRILKKARERSELSLEEMEELDPERALEMKEELEEARVRERFTLKHKNTSKWAMRAKRQKDKHSRAAIQEQLEIHDSLAKKIHRDSDSDSDSESGGEDAEDPGEEAGEGGAAPSGLFALKFMQKAEERKRKRAQEMLGDGAALDEELESERAGRRKMYAAAREAAKSGEDVSVDAGEPDGGTSFRRAFQPSGSQRAAAPVAKPKKKRSRHADAGSESVHAGSFAEVPGGSEERSRSDRGCDENAVELQDDDSASAVHVDVSSAALVGRAAEKGFSMDQKSIVKEAFVGDDIAAEDFAQELEEELEQEAKAKGKNATSALPGWGSWAGAGVKQQPKNKQPRKEKKRKRVQTVHINPKKEKRAAKYQADKVPYPFTSRDQYEQSLAQPLGADWNTASASKRMTMPKVTTRVGAIIDPLSYSGAASRPARTDRS